MNNKKIYFASDFHLGVPTYEKSLTRERLLVRWLDTVKQDAEEIYLVGDLFDFWFEYKYTAPKGYIRFLGKIAEIVDSGIPVHVFTGNHDMWMYGYLPKELGVTMHREPITRIWNEKKLVIGHGDGLGPGDRKYKFLKKFFASKVCQWLFARIHPNLAFGIANYFSKSSRASTGKKDEIFKGNEDEWLYTYCKEYLQKEHVDYFIFGHRHLPLDIQLNDNSKYINLGEWLNYNTYAVFDGEKVELNTFK
ncbi:MAG: UDP-2,3-diacylglucosamine diphosphatase [Bacteroidota bacterium]|nr:UDP-2,3-diacylglucosamine diphosphatase [Bacteroidota bacterium]